MKRTLGFCILLHPHYQIIEYRRKAQPANIGQLQKCGYFIGTVELDRHPDNQPQQDQQPYQGKGVGPEIEKQQGPAEVYRQLHHHQIESPASGNAAAFQCDPGGADAHEREQNAPYNAEYHSRGRNGGLWTSLI